MENIKLKLSPPAEEFVDILTNQDDTSKILQNPIVKEILSSDDDFNNSKNCLLGVFRNNQNYQSQLSDKIKHCTEIYGKGKNKKTGASVGIIFNIGFALLFTPKAIEGNTLNVILLIFIGILFIKNLLKIVVVNSDISDDYINNIKAIKREAFKIMRAIIRYQRAYENLQFCKDHIVYEPDEIEIQEINKRQMEYIKLSSMGYEEIKAKIDAAKLFKVK